MDWSLARLGGGYGRIDGAVYATYLVVTDEVAEAEQDDFLRISAIGRCSAWRRGGGCSSG